MAWHGLQKDSHHRSSKTHHGSHSSSAVTGAAMDTVVPRAPAASSASRVAVLTAAWPGPAGSSCRTACRWPAATCASASVEQGVFRDDIVVRASAEPLNRSSSTRSNPAASRKCSRRTARRWSRKARLLFRLSNPQRNLELLARQTEYAQQIFNLANLRVAQEAVRTDHQRRLSDLEFALEPGREAACAQPRLAARASSPRWRWKSRRQTRAAEARAGRGKARRRHRGKGARPRAGPAGKRPARPAVRPEAGRRHRRCAGRARTKSTAC
jgi:hypothetical protein